MKRIRLPAALSAAAAVAILPTSATAQVNQTYQFNLPRQELGDALRAVAAKAGLQLFARAEDVNNIPAPQLQANLTARQAIERLLVGTGLNARFDKGTVIVRQQSEAGSPTNNDSADIVVTGSRIKGVPSAAPVTVITRNDIKNAGQADLGEVVRSLPFNFSGGQNPGVGVGAGQTVEDANVNGATSVNLFGLGPNGTLTMLNGNRLSYTGVNAAVDISAIPVAAVERIEIVPDGASALYGADAVAGVVNVRLRRDYQGLTVSARLGASSAGGGFQQQYNAVAGQKWTSGSILAAYDYQGTAPVYGRQRSYASGISSDATLYPRLDRHSALVQLIQDFGGGAELSIDALYKKSDQDIARGFFAGQSYLAFGGSVHAKATSFTLAPDLSIPLGSSWTARVISSYSTDKTSIASNLYMAESILSAGTRRYNNSSGSIELGAQGHVVELPGGPVRAAFGLGYRRVGLDLVTTNAGQTYSDFKHHRQQ